MANLIKRAIGFLGLIFCFWMFEYFVYPKCNTAIQSLKWPSVMGKIVRCELDSTYKHTEKRTASSRRKKKKTKMYQLQLEYNYSVDGQYYRGKGRCFDLSEPQQSWKSSLEKFIAKHPKTSPIEVFYAPENPDQSTIIKGLSLIHWALLLANLVFTLMFAHLITFPHLWKLQTRSG